MKSRYIFVMYSQSHAVAHGRTRSHAVAHGRTRSHTHMVVLLEYESKDMLMYRTRSLHTRNISFIAYDGYLTRYFLDILQYFMLIFVEKVDHRIEFRLRLLPQIRVILTSPHVVWNESVPLQVGSHLLYLRYFLLIFR